jgi:hypothetical protein
MRNVELVKQIQRIKDLIGKTTDASNGNIELQSHWAKYLCVLCAGLLENSVSELYGDYAKNKSNQEINHYVLRSLEKYQNPKTKKFIEIAACFNDRWAQDLETFVDNDGRREAIDSIIANRHLIVHGENSGITIVRIKEYFKKIVEVLEFIESQLS